MQQAIEDITLAAANHDMVLVKDQPIDAALKKRITQRSPKNTQLCGNCRRRASSAPAPLP